MANPDQHAILQTSLFLFNKRELEGVGVGSEACKGEECHVHGSHVPALEEKGRDARGSEFPAPVE